MKFHHFGFASKDIDEDAKLFTALGFVFEDSTFVDEWQQVRGRFLKLADFRIELLENWGEGKRLDPWLRTKSAGPYQIAFEVESKSRGTEIMSSTGFVQLEDWVPAPGLGDAEIAFYYRPNSLLYELIFFPSALVAPNNTLSMSPRTSRENLRQRVEPEEWNICT